MGWFYVNLEVLFECVGKSFAVFDEFSLSLLKSLLSLKYKKKSAHPLHTYAYIFLKSF